VENPASCQSPLDLVTPSCVRRDGRESQLVSQESFERLPSPLGVVLEDVAEIGDALKHIPF